MGEGPVSLASYFALAAAEDRRPAARVSVKGVSALEMMTKWFDAITYMVPEFAAVKPFR